MSEFLRQTVVFFYYQKSHHEKIKENRKKIIRAFIAFDEDFFHIEMLIHF
jgi:hypothetical protein